MVILIFIVLHRFHVVPVVLFLVLGIVIVALRIVVVVLAFLVLFVHFLVVLLVAITVISGRHSAALVGMEVGLGPVHIILVASRVGAFVVLFVFVSWLALVVASILVVLVVLLHVWTALPPVLVLATSVIVVAVLV